MKNIKKMEIIFILPVYNEEKDLENSTKKLFNYLATNLKKDLDWKIVITDNASTDQTSKIGKSISERNKKIIYHKINRKGRGYALKEIYRSYEGDIYFYMDIDLSTDINHIPQFIDAIIAGNDIVIGTRLTKESKTTRGFYREFTSRSYNFVSKIMVGTKISDLQCGFKAINKKVAKEIAPLVKDNEWFFDSEMLLLSEKKGYSIKETPVKWVDDPNSKVKVIKTTINYLKNLNRMRKVLKNI